MIKIELISTEVETISGTAKATGKPYSFRKQAGYLHGAGKYPERFMFPLQDGQAPYATGLYTIAPDAIGVDRDGKLSISPRFQAVAQAANRAA